MLTLNKKLYRDLFRMKGQVLAIALIIASGAANLVMSVSAIDMLEETGQAYYERYRFADVFAGLKRAPERLRLRISEIPGVQTVETRITRLATLSIAGFDEPVLGQLLSVPDLGRPQLNRLVLRAGRWLSPGRSDEALISEPFAESHDLQPGGKFQVILNGRKRTLKVAGVVLSPEYVYAIAPGALMPDDKRYGIVWMSRKALASAYDLDEAFNNVSLSLLRGAKTEQVLARLDALLERYGGTGAIARKDQLSNWFLQNEIKQQKAMSMILPTIFLAAAAFLSNMILARLISIDRDEIGLMKAFGYSNWDVGWLYMKMVTLMALPGILLGWVSGYGFATWMAHMYGSYFKFPFLLQRPGLSVFVIAAGISLAAALIGTLSAVSKAVRLPPAEAMRPPVPTAYKSGGFLSSLFQVSFDQPTRMIFRHFLRWPVRTGLSALGVGLGVAVLIIAFFWSDSVSYMIRSYFIEAQKQDVTVALTEAQSKSVLQEFKRMPGVLMAEGERSIGVRFKLGPRVKRGALTGVRPEARLNLVYDVSGHLLQVPDHGVVLSTMLAKVLGARLGDMIEIEVLEGRRPVLRLPVSGLFETYIGTPAYIHLDVLGRKMREAGTVNLVHLKTDPGRSAILYKRLRNTPGVAAVSLHEAALKSFRNTMDETIMVFVAFFSLFAGALTFGTVYNTARISLSERQRELATLRVLGAGKMTVSYILLGEVALLTLVSLPLGCLIGYGLAGLMTASFETELYRIPFFILPSSYGMAAVFGVAVSVVSALWVRRGLDRLDLIAVLKTRD
ncbi:MAG: permease [Hyphomicrobiales bacterium]|nr:MAG: permease [Hyphomicrobiales bacterium]